MRCVCKLIILCIRSNDSTRNQQQVQKLLITDKCQQKLGLGVLQTTVHTGRSPPNYSTDYSQDSWLQSSWNRQRTGVPQAARYISMVIGWPALVLIFKTFDTVFGVPTLLQHILLYCTQTLMSSDFIEQLLHKNKQLQTLITVGLALLMTYKQNKYSKSSHSIIHASSS